MAKRISISLRNYLAMGGGWGDALANGALYIMSGSQPTNPDTARTGTVLAKFTWKGGTATKELRARAYFKLNAMASSGEQIALTIGGNTAASNYNGMPIMVPVPYNSSISQTVTDIVYAINNYRKSSVVTLADIFGGPHGFTAVKHATNTDEFYVDLPKGWGALLNEVPVSFDYISTGTLSVTCNGVASGTLATTSAAVKNHMYAAGGNGAWGAASGGGAAGVNAQNMLNFKIPTIGSPGVLYKEDEPWQCYAGSSGFTSGTQSAGWFRFYGVVNPYSSTTQYTQDPELGSDTVGYACDGTNGYFHRFDGSIGISGSDMTVASTSITHNSIQTINSFTITIPQTQ